MKHSTRTLIATAAAAAVVTGTAATATYAATRTDHFGHTTVRSGIPKHTPRFTVTSPELAAGTFPAADYAAAFGCTGANHVPTIDWSGAPAGTQSYAVSMFDEDAPTGSGFWHWMNWDVPATARTFPAAAPGGTVAGVNNAGTVGYLGPCPPAGDIAHRYVIRVLALDVPSLGLPASTQPGLASFAMSGHVVGEAEMTVTAQR